MKTAPCYVKSVELITRASRAQRLAKNAKKNLANAHVRSVNNPSHAMAAVRIAKRNLMIANVNKANRPSQVQATRKS